MSSSFWDKKILGWEAARYDGEVGVTGWPLRNRMKIAANILQSLPEGLRLTDLGCGTGRLFELLRQEQFSELLGIDFAKPAIDLAQTKDFQAHVSFLCASVSGPRIPESDCYVALGLVDWLSDQDIRGLFQQFENKFFLVSFSEKRSPLLRLPHALFRRVTGKTLNLEFLPRYHSLTELTAFVPLGQAQRLRVIRHLSMAFGSLLTNIPPEVLISESSRQANARGK